MRLSDKNIAVLMAAANQSDPEAIGYGDILLMGAEIQERRAADVPKIPEWQVNEAVTSDTLVEALIKRVNDKEFVRDSLVLALFHAMQRQGYFQTITFVDRDALKQVLNALNGEPYLIRELQATRNLPRVEGEKLNAIDQLIQDFKGPENAAD